MTIVGEGGHQRVPLGYRWVASAWADGDGEGPDAEATLWVGSAEDAVAVAMCWLGGLPARPWTQLHLIGPRGEESSYIVQPDERLHWVAVAM